ncbi:MAG: exopolysaccharide production protein ExoQ [Parvicellaceae bacterium]
MSVHQNSRLPVYIKKAGIILTLILFFKIVGYFSIVEDRGITQIFKIIFRIGCTGFIFFYSYKLRKLGCIQNFEYKNLFSPILYTLYLILGLASFMWSTDPAYSALQLGMTVESFVFVIVFIQVVYTINFHFPQHEVNMVRLFANAIIPILLTFLIGSLISEDTFYRGMRGGEEQRLGGYLMNPNELGMLSSIGAAMCYLSLKFDKKFWVIIKMIIAMIVLALTSSRSSMIGFFLITAIIGLMTKNKKIILVMVVGAVISVPLALKFVIFKDGGGVEEVMSMTGRLPFWTALLNEGIVKEPWLGYGFMRINYTDYFQGLFTYPGKMTHNTFMQVLMNLGFIGFFIAFWNVVCTVRNFVIEKVSPYRQFFIALFIPILINSFTEFGFFGDANYGILFYQYLIVLFVIKQRKHMTSFDRVSLNRLQKRFGAVSN